MNPALLRFVWIVLGAVFLACALGVSLDMVTAHVAVEYFTVKHPKIVDSEEPIVMALLWGVGASWWFGLIGGIVVGGINQLRREPLKPIRILRWAGIACVVLWVIMLTIMLAILAFAQTIPVEARRPTFDYDARMVAVAMAHQYEYVLGAIAMLVIGIMTWRSKTAVAPVAEPV